MHALWALALLAAVTASSASASAQDSPAARSNRGFKTQLSPVLLLNPDNNQLGGGLELGLRYGIQAGPVIIGPGARVGGYYLPKRFVGHIMPTVRLTVPAGPFAPFLEGGVGPAMISNPSDKGVAVMAGVGFMIHFGSVLGIGARAGYETVVDRGYKSFSFGPLLQFGF